MILKIERYREDERWWLVDKIDRIASTVRLETDTVKKRKEALIRLADLTLFDIPKCDCFWNEDIGCNFCNEIPKDYRICRLRCRLENGDDYTVLFDTIAYILNDNGKTIEKIEVNYKDIMIK